MQTPTDQAADPSQLVNALLAHNWYATAAITLMLLIQIARKNELRLWTAIPNGYRFIWPVTLAAAAAFVHGFVLHETLEQALYDALNSCWQIALPAMGGAAVLKESKLPWDGGAGGKPTLTLTEVDPPISVYTTEAPTNPDIHPHVTLVKTAPAELNTDDRPTPVDPSVVPPSTPPDAA